MLHRRALLRAGTGAAAARRSRSFVPCLSRAGRRAAALAGHFKEQELSNVVWALGRAQHLDLSLLEPLLAVVRARLPAFMPQGISNMLWALGQLRYHDEQLMAALSRECVRNLHAYDAQASL